MPTIDTSPAVVERPAEVEDYDALGVIFALEKVCELESRLRQAIQQTHPLTTTLDWDLSAADREREALLAISEQLEYLEDKLREYRFLDQSHSDQKAVVLGQLDSARRELLDVVAINLPRLVFGKEVVREVLAFATAGDDTPRGGISPATLSAPSSSLRKSRNPAKDPRASSSSPALFTMLTSSPKPSSQPSSRFIDPVAVPVPGSTTAGGGARAKDNAAPHRMYSSTSPHINITDEDIYGPAQPSAKGAVRPPRGAGPAAAAAAPTDASYGGMVRIREMLSRAEQGLTAVAEAQGQRRMVPPRVTGGEDHNGYLSPRSNKEGGSTADWDGISPSASTTPRGEGSLASPQWELRGSQWEKGGTPVSLRGRYSEWSIKADRSSVRNLQASPGFAAATPRWAASEAPSTCDSETRRGGGLQGVVGKLAGLAFVLGSIAAAAAAATGGVGSSKGKAASTSTPKRSGSSAGTKKRSTAIKRSSGPADMPPWKDATANGPRPKASSGKSTNSTSTKVKRSSDAPPAQAPVMHVHHPPSSRSFPSNPPPDVTAAMG